MSRSKTKFKTWLFLPWSECVLRLNFLYAAYARSRRHVFRSGPVAAFVENKTANNLTLRKRTGRKRETRLGRFSRKRRECRQKTVVTAVVTSIHIYIYIRWWGCVHVILLTRVSGKTEDDTAGLRTIVIRNDRERCTHTDTRLLTNTCVCVCVCVCAFWKHIISTDPMRVIRPCCRRVVLYELGRNGRNGSITRQSV